MARREALLICAETFSDATFRRLRSPSVDVSGLAAVLEDKSIGAFHVEQMIDRPCHDVRRSVERFYQDREPDDLLLLYLSGHGHRDMFGRLHFICADTEMKHLKATALPSAFISEIAQESKSRRQVLIVDSCFSGAFMKGMSLKSSEHSLTGSDFPSGGRGQVIFTASTAFQYSLEGSDVLGEAQPSLFTKHLIEGLSSGDADLNNDGIIDLDELYQYLHARTTQEAHQTPQRWALQMEGVIPFATNQRPRKGLVPSDVQELLEHSHPGVRLQGVEELKRLLGSGRPGSVLAASDELHRLAANDDSQRVREAASMTLRSLTPRQWSNREFASEAEGATQKLGDAASLPEASLAARSDAAQRLASDLKSLKVRASALAESIGEPLAQQPVLDAFNSHDAQSFEDEARPLVEVERANVGQGSPAGVKKTSGRRRLLQLLVALLLIVAGSIYLISAPSLSTEELFTKVQAGDIEVDTLSTLYRRELTPEQRAAIGENLAGIIRSGNRENRFLALLYINDFAPGGQYVSDVAKVLDDKDSYDAGAAASYLASVGAPGQPYIPKIAELLTSASAGARREALKALTTFGPEALQPYLPAIKEMLNDPDQEVQQAAKDALAKL